MTITHTTLVEIERTANNLDYMFSCKVDHYVDTETGEQTGYDIFDARIEVFTKPDIISFYKGKSTLPQIRWFEEEIENIPYGEKRYKNDREFVSS